jgi:predicted protein tyrosine phosphatase
VPAKRILFICGKSRHRSPTAAQVFAARPDMETDAAGLSDDADIPLSPEQLEWATDIVVMKKAQIARLRRKFSRHVSGKRIVSLDIPDNFTFMQPELIALLEQKAKRFT